MSGTWECVCVGNGELCSREAQCIKSSPKIMCQRSSEGLIRDCTAIRGGF